MEKSKDYITIEDIARALNLSKSTVSRALKDHPRISKKTKEKVRNLAEELDYQPNPMALNLYRQKTNTIGIIVPKISYNFYSLAISGIEDVAINAGYNIVICQSNESYEREVMNTNDLLATRVDGFIVALAGSTQQFDHFEKIKKKDIPLIFFNRVTEQINTSKVIVDNYGAAYETVSHLVEQGCKKIAFLAGPRYFHISNLRLNGYLDALKDHHIQVEEKLIIHNDFNQQTATENTRELLNNGPKPDGIFAISDRLAIGAFLAIQSAGLRIPQDIALAGFNNDPITTLIAPPLTSVDQDAFAIGKTAAELLLDQLNNKTEIQPVTKKLNTRLVIRESSMKDEYKEISNVK